MDRKQIGLIYAYNETWIGGTYYVENIIKALDALPDGEKPFLHIFTKDEDTYRQLQEKVNYPHCKYHSLTVTLGLFKRFINFVSVKTTGKNYIRGIKNEKEISFYYPNPNAFIFKDVSPKKLVYWIPDFQEIHLPHCFSEAELGNKALQRSHMALTAQNIVFSSSDALKDFQQLYPECQAKLNILRFTVHSQADTNISSDIWEAIKSKYQITDDYFLCPNQLWMHKNHITVLKALRELKNSTIKVLFSGKEEDYRNPNFPAELKTRVDEYDISNVASFIGFIPKSDLDILIQNATAIVQPSLFEGWNTGLEEAKLKNKFIIASNINVHQEQLNDYPNKVFFEKENDIQLAQILNTLIVQIQPYNYQEKTLAFARQFVNINI
ncbi:glycosyltransferase [Saccharicrinis fermentans]|uniref:Glycosyltransferase n=1 Tax=Saccharicrinis fermentans DSM 9555 = JCM 21142 TaxID=869213 RepID=W7Y9B9_9BACT|nr:glycosyltransferase [Saccharicrinis fermentans]GAF04937.1 glycosyltransferase [Saccharicrinis fermentans DSM 9555 = JCM 21142]